MARIPAEFNWFLLVAGFLFFAVGTSGTAVSLFNLITLRSTDPGEDIFFFFVSSASVYASLVFLLKGVVGLFWNEQIKVLESENKPSEATSTSTGSESV